MQRKIRRIAMVVAALVSAATVLAAGAANAAPAQGVPAGSFYTEVINRDSGKCVNVRHGSSGERVAIQQYHCDKTPAVKFLFRDQGADASGVEWYQIENQGSRRCVSPASWTDDPWQPDELVQLGCLMARYEMWKLTRQVSGAYELVNQETGRCLGTPGWSREDWTQLQEQHCSPGQANQEWWLHLG